MNALRWRCLFLSSLLLLGLWGFPREGGDPAFQNNRGQEEIAAISLPSLASDPAAHVEKTYRIIGKLRNRGRNYFTDLQVVLEDEKCDSIYVYVRPWLPLEFPPPPPGRPELKKPGLSQFLDKRVELTATVERGSLKTVGEVYYLSVKAAKILDKNSSL